MKRANIYAFILVGGFVLASCNEQEVEPIDSPNDNPMITITPRADYSSLKEGDTLIFDITTDKMIQSPLAFDVVLDEGATADEDDFVVSGGTLAGFSSATTMQVIITADMTPETGETFAFRLEPDFAWEWQIHPDSDREPTTVALKDLDYTLDWSAGSHDGADLCESGIDLDIFLLNADQSEGDFSGATGACPLEHGTMTSLPDDTYDIYVDYYDGNIPAGAAVTIPYVVTFSNNSGELYVIEGSFNSDEVGAATHVIGQVIISGGSYTLIDADGNEIGPI